MKEYFAWYEHDITDRQRVLDAVKQDGLNLRFASGSLQNDKEIVITATKENPFAFQYASPPLKRDKDFVLFLMKISFLVIAYASPELQRDPELLELIPKPQNPPIDEENFLLQKELLTIKLNQLRRENNRQRLLLNELNEILKALATEQERSRQLDSEMKKVTQSLVLSKNNY